MDKILAEKIVYLMYLLVLNTDCRSSVNAISAPFETSTRRVRYLKKSLTASIPSIRIDESAHQGKHMRMYYSLLIMFRSHDLWPFSLLWCISVAADGCSWSVVRRSCAPGSSISADCSGRRESCSASIARIRS